jgi:hypothetical protein
MIELKITAETPEQFRVLLASFLPRVTVNEIPMDLPEDIEPPIEKANMGHPPTEPEVEQPARRKRRTKAEVEAEAKPAKKPEPEPDPVSEGTTYWLDNEKPEVFILDDGDKLPNQNDIAAGIVEQLTDEAEYLLMKRRVEKEIAKQKGAATAFKEEVEEEAGEVTQDDLLLAINELIDAYPTDKDVEAGTLAKQIMARVAKAERASLVPVELRAKVLKELKAAAQPAAVKAHLSGRR